MGNKNVVIFIHGLGADDPDWWGSTANALRNNPEISSTHDIRFYNYKTDKIKTLLGKGLDLIKKGEVESTLKDLGLSFAQELESKYEKYESIKLFGHSMGGIVISAAIPVLHSETPSLYNRITSISFCGTPIGGSKLSSLVKLFAPFIPSNQAKNLSIQSKDLKSITSPLPNYLSVYTQKSKKTIDFFKLKDDGIVSKDEERYGLFNQDMIDYKIQPITLDKGHSESVQDLNSNDSNFVKIQKWILKENFPKEKVIQNTPEIKYSKESETTNSKMKETTFSDFLNTLDFSTLEKISILAHTGKNTIEKIRMHIEDNREKIKQLNIELLLKSPLSEQSDRYEQLHTRLNSNIKELNKHGILIEVRYYHMLPTFQSIICTQSNKKQIGYISFYKWNNNKSEGQKIGYYTQKPSDNILFQSHHTLYSHLFGKSKLHTIIFDFDDTLFDTFNIQIEAWEYTLQKLYSQEDKKRFINNKLLVLFLEENPKTLLKNELKEIFKITYNNSQRFNLILKDFDNKVLQYIEQIRFDKRQELTKTAILFDGVKDKIIELSKKYFLVIISATTEDVINTSLKYHNIDSYFSIILGRDNKDYISALEEKSSKILKISNLHGIPLDRILFIGDSTTDYNASNQLGVQFISINIVANRLGIKTFIDYSTTNNTSLKEVTNYLDNSLIDTINKFG